MFSIKQAWYIGLAASIIVWIGEFLLHYSPKILEVNDLFDYFAFVPLEHLVIWHFFVIPGILLYFIGYYHLYLMLKWGGEKIARAFLFIAMFWFLCGWIWISSRAFIGHIVHISDTLDPDTYIYIRELYLFFFDSLLQVIRYSMLVLSGFWVYLILTGKTMYPKKMILCSPIILLLLVFTSLSVPTIGKYLVPIALNIAHFILFSFSLICLAKSEKK